MVKAAFVPFSATGGKPAIARVARLSGVSPHPIPDTTTAHPNVAPYQLSHTRIFNFCHDTTARGKNKVFSVCGHLCGQSCFCAAFGNRRKSRKRRCHKTLRRFALTRPGYRHGTPKYRALPVEPHPDIHFSAIISRRSRKSKIFLSAPVPMGKLVFAPLSVVSRNPANADAARLSGGSSYPVPDTAAVLSSAALSIGLPLILRIRRPHAGGVSTIPVFSPACKGKMALRLTAPELPSAHPRGRSSPRPRPDPRAPCGRKPPACGKWACADPAPE